MNSVIRNKLQRKFKMRGYIIKFEALSEFHRFLSHFPGAEDEALDILLEELLLSPLQGGFQFMVMLHKMPHCIRIDFSCCSRSFLVTPIFPLLFLLVIFLIMVAVRYSLVGQRGKKWVMGLISQLEDCHFYLEDLTAAVEVDLSDAISSANMDHHTS